MIALARTCSFDARDSLARWFYDMLPAADGDAVPNETDRERARDLLAAAREPVDDVHVEGTARRLRTAIIYAAFAAGDTRLLPLEHLADAITMLLRHYPGGVQRATLWARLPRIQRTRWQNATELLLAQGRIRCVGHTKGALWFHGSR